MKIAELVSSHKIVSVAVVFTVIATSLGGVYALSSDTSEQSKVETQDSAVVEDTDQTEVVPITSTEVVEPSTSSSPEPQSESPPQQPAPQDMTPQQRVQAYDASTIEGAVEIVYGAMDETYKSEAKRCLNLLMAKKPSSFDPNNKVIAVQNFLGKYRPDGVCRLADSL